MRSRLKDIAHDLNLSTGLVSGVLNRRDNVWASEETRKRIFDAAKRMNYVPTPSTTMRPVATRRSLELVYCRGNLSGRNPLGSIVDTLSEEAERDRLSLVTSGFGSLDRAVEYLESQSGPHPALFVLWGSDEDVREMGCVLATRGTPFVVLGRQDGAGSTWPQCSLNFEEMMIGAVDHVRVQGHSRIAYLGAEADAHSSREMLDSYLRRMVSCFGKEPPPEFVVVCDADAETTHRRIAPLLDSPADERPTGFVVTGGNEAWLGLETCLAERGFTIGYRNGLPTASGLFEGAFRLLYGDALGYDLSDPGFFLSGVLRLLIDSLLGGSTEAPSQRLAPRLTRIPSLHLPFGVMEAGMHEVRP